MKKIKYVKLEITPLDWMITPVGDRYNNQRKIMFLCFVIIIDYNS